MLSGDFAAIRPCRAGNRQCRATLATATASSSRTTATTLTCACSGASLSAALGRLGDSHTDRHCDNDRYNHYEPHSSHSLSPLKISEFWKTRMTLLWHDMKSEDGC
jgi:hypothetical protein